MYVSEFEAVKVMLSPEHPTKAVALTVGIGALLTFTEVAAEVAEQPFPSVVVTVYVPVDVTVIVCVVAVVDQTFPFAVLDVKSTEPPVQNDVAPFAEIVGVTGVAFIVTTIADLRLSSPLALYWLTQ